MGVEAASLAEWFGECYGSLPELIWHAPGRVNLIGEHTDYNGGLVLPFAIELGVLTAAAARDDDVLQMRSRQVAGETVAVSLDRLEPGAVTGWAGYVAGAAWALASAGYPVGGASVAIDSDLPVGAGLASSAALCCAAVSCLAALAGWQIGPAQVAALARSAEADFVGMPCGIMDQSAAMLAQPGHALLLDCGTGASSLVPVEPAASGLAIAVADTGVRHGLADGQYAARRADCLMAARLLGVASLGAVNDVADLVGLHDEVLLRRARHVVSEDIRVREVAALLEAGHLGDCGELLTQSHISLRDDFEVSWPAADASVEAALSAGALGARMTGAGFGGCVLVLVAADRLATVHAAISKALGEGDLIFLEVQPGPGARLRAVGGPRR
jgi:galactokinase